MPENTIGRRTTMKRILHALRKTHGPRTWQRWGKGVDILVQTILSQNTSDANSSAGFARLKRRFRSWNQVMDTPVDEVETCIRISGLSRIKAPRIQSILRQIKQDRGRIDLDFLAQLPPDEACDYLMKFDGVGPKTANCVLLFSFGMPVFPVDTHIHRIAMRMGLIPDRCSADEAHELLREMIAENNRYEMHILLIEHGRRVCKAQNPDCDNCRLRTLCAYGLARAATSALTAPATARAGRGPSRVPALYRRRSAPPPAPSTPSRANAP